MKKVFLYLYPIEDFTKVFVHDDTVLNILNDTIDKRYRSKGYQIVYAMYYDKEIYGIKQEKEDIIIYTDIPFSATSLYDELGNKKINFIPSYPNEIFLLEQLGDVEELVIGGYHSMDCVKRVAETASSFDIFTLVDLDLTDLFFSVYKDTDYFVKENYSPERFRNNMINKRGKSNIELSESLFDRLFSSSVYGFKNSSKTR